MSEDPQLIKRALDGDRTAFDEIVRRYQDGLFRHLLRLGGRPEEAEDLCQEAFIRFYAALRRFDPARPVAPFLFAIATNLWRERARKAHFQEQPLGEQQPASGSSVAEQAVLRLERGQILAAVARLQPEQREALSLYYDQGLSYREIARITRAPMGTVSTRLRRALDALRRALGPETAGLVIAASGRDPLGTILIPALQAQGAAPSSLAPAIAHGIAHAAPAGVGLLHGVWTLWKEASLMMKGISVALGLAVVGGATVGVPRLIGGNGAGGVKQAAVVRAEKFEMLDSQGRVQASLSVKREGAGYVLLVHSSWKVQMDQPLRARRFEVPDAKGRVCATLQVRDTGDPVLTLWHPLGNHPRARLELRLVESDGSGSPELTLSDAEGRPRLGLALRRDGSPILALQDEKGQGVFKAP